DRQRDDRGHARLRDDRRVGADRADCRAPVPGFRRWRRNRAGDDVHARGRAAKPALVLRELAVGKPEFGQPGERNHRLPARTVAFQIEPERLGVARPVRDRSVDRPGRGLYQKPARRDPRHFAAPALPERRRDPRDHHSIHLARPPARSRAHQRRDDHPIFSHHDDALCDPDASHAGIERDAWHAHARRHRRPRGAGRGALGRSLGHSRGRDCAAHCADDRAVSGDEAGGATLVLAITILSLLHAASVAVVVALTPLISPPAVRATGLAITYSLGVAIFGGTATYVVTWLVGVTGDPLASTYYVMAANVVLVLAVLAVRNTEYETSRWPPPVESEV